MLAIYRAVSWEILIIEKLAQYVCYIWGHAQPLGGDGDLYVNSPVGQCEMLICK